MNISKHTNLFYYSQNVNFRYNKTAFAERFAFVLQFKVQQKHIVYSQKLILNMFQRLEYGSSGLRNLQDDLKDTENKERSAPSKKFEDEEFEALLDQDPCQTQEELGKNIGSHSTSYF